MTDLYGDFGGSDGMEDNDDDIEALGSILSWDDNDDEGQAISGSAAAISAALKEREGGSGTSAPPDMVQFSTKDGVPQFNFLQNYQGANGTSQHESSLSGEASGNGNRSLTMQLPLPTPVSCLEQNDELQAQTKTSDSSLTAQQPPVASGIYQQQQGSIQQFLQQSRQPQVQQNQQQPPQPTASAKVNKR